MATSVMGEVEAEADAEAGKDPPCDNNDDCEDLDLSEWLELIETVDAEEVSRRWEAEEEEEYGPIGLFSCSALVLRLLLLPLSLLSLDSASNGDPGLVDREVGRVLDRRLASKDRVDAGRDCFDCWGVAVVVAVVRDDGVEMVGGARIGEIARPMIWTV